MYRSQAPTEENLPYLARMKLRNVLFLSPEVIDVRCCPNKAQPPDPKPQTSRSSPKALQVLMRGVVDWMADNNVVLHNLGLQRWKPGENQRIPQ